MKKPAAKPKTSEEFDSYFETHDIADLLDASPKRVNLDLPPHVLKRLDLKAQNLGITRQALIKYWIAEHLGLT